MKFIFWLAILIESIVLGYYLRQVWIFKQKDATGDYHDPYGKVLIPAVVLGIIIISGLLPIKLPLGTGCYSPNEHAGVDPARIPGVWKTIRGRKCKRPPGR